ncbi:hypothetical protein C8J57DRAFT_8112 [Mycena rebaudengoi]|nr:hypothetical protein C8J57DRAFT_8112 [Mycena rebaudengoi]
MEEAPCPEFASMRNLPSLLWACFFALCGSTWAALHLDVPADTLGKWAPTARKCTVFFIAIIAPELLVGLATREFCAAHALRTRHGLSKLHAWFIIMGGFATPAGTPILTEHQLRQPTVINSIKNTCPKDITDKSKADVWIKVLAILQLAWFLIRCIIRLGQKLVLIQLEVSALAFTVIQILVCALWWDKPRDVQTPIHIGSLEADVDLGSFPNQTWLQHLISGSGLFRERSFLQIFSSWDPSIFPAADEDNNIQYAHFINGVLALVFGGIHCAAWNSTFPSTAEMWIWRVASIATSLIPALIYLFNQCLDRLSTRPTKWAKVLAAVARILFLALYLCSRVALFTLSWTSVRTLPPGALKNFKWAGYIPLP